MDDRHRIFARWVTVIAAACLVGYLAARVVIPELATALTGALLSPGGLALILLVWLLRRRTQR